MSHMESIKMSLDDLKRLDKTTRKIIYNHKLELGNVLRYNLDGIVVPREFEESLKDNLSYLRIESSKVDGMLIYNKGKMLKASSNKKGRIFEVGGKKLHELELSGNTYKHIGTQGIELYKYSKISLENGDIDKFQDINDKIRNNLHDWSEYITDDVPSFNKTTEFREREKDVEHSLINDCGLLIEKEKKYLIKILDYKENSRFKAYEYLLRFKDAIDMYQNNDKYNNVLSVIYEILKFNIPKFLGKIELDSGEKIEMLKLSGIKQFILDHKSMIDELFLYLKDNQNRLFLEDRFLNENYDKNDLNKNYEKFQSDWNYIKNMVEKK